jgi:alkaline phosphatase D
MNITRRHAVSQTLAFLGAAALPRTALLAQPEFPSDPFTLGVASGYPTDHSAVLWTRLAPLPAQADGGMPPADVPVRFEVARDEQFRKIQVRGTTTALAAYAHSARVEVKGLQAAHDYWYRFTVGRYRSRVGRTRTLPAAARDVAAFSMAVTSCQHYEHGHYAAWRHIASDAPDLIMHVGDYIYEGAPTTGRVRTHTGALCRTLDEYRQRYALYQQDDALQAAHAASPWLAMWDDHEVANDYSGIYSGRNEEPAAFLARRTAAYQAYFEHLPLPMTMAPRGAELPLFARREIGRLATLHLLDQRQYRSAQACPQPGRAGGNRVSEECIERLDASRTMLGAAQEQWLDQGLQAQHTQWTLLAQGTMFTQLDEQPGPRGTYWSDAWTGYPAARQRLIDSLQRRRASNPVIFSGDLHAFVVSGVNAVPERLDTPLVAAEFVATSISSDARPQDSLDAWRANNPQILLMEGRSRGYLSVRLSAARMQTDLVAINDVNQPDSGRRVLQSYVVEAGNPSILPA